MVNDQTSEDATLSAVLHRYAQHAPPRQFRVEMAIGVVVTGAAALLRPASWIVIASIGCASAMLGLWSWADRAIDAAEVGTPDRAWRLLRAVAAVIGICSLMLSAFAVLARMLGTWIS